MGACMRRSFSSRLLSALFRVINRFVAWHRLPQYLGAVNLLSFRETLREKNLHDTSKLPSTAPPSNPSLQAELLSRRTADGTFNDLSDPLMGSALSRFGRNVPLHETWPDKGQDLLSPSPRLISNRLLRRDEFVPATTLNLLAAAWIQFMTHDWFDHGKPVRNGNDFPVPLDNENGDDWHEDPMRIRPTPADATRYPNDQSGPPTYLNAGSHWWDASQIYGNSDEQTLTLRCSDQQGKGKLELSKRDLSDDELVARKARTARGPARFRSAEEQEQEESEEEGLPPSAVRGVVEQAGVTNNWWIGLSLLHTLFAREHNAIVDRLQIAYPDWSGDQLFHTARLINTALMAKIHTVEWTTAILGHPALQISMNANWWGLVTERITKAFGRLSDNEAIGGIPGSPTDHHSAPYALTEEFVAVYRLHPLMPDGIQFYRVKDGSQAHYASLPDVAGENSLSPYRRKLTRADVAYSFGIAHPGAVVLHNYPDFLRNLERVDRDGAGNEIARDRIDLAAIDIMRDRERGVPRYNRFRRLLGLRPVASFPDITSNKTWARELEEIYKDVERVDLMVGMFAEDFPKGFGFSDTAFRVFILMASRRLKSDRFFTADFNENVYSGVGLNWINDNNMRSILLRHYPLLAPVLRQVNNAFAPWQPIGHGVSPAAGTFH
jgi:Animal haem peroxidase